MKNIYDLGDGMIPYIKHTSIELLMKSKIDRIVDHFNEFDLSEDEKKAIFFDIIEDKESINFLEKQLPFWELIYGICLLCGQLVYYRESTSLIVDKINTWSDLAKEQK